MSLEADALDYWRTSIRIAIHRKGRRRDFAIAAISTMARSSEHRSVRRLAALRLTEIEIKRRAS
jgi:hypothetical protein